MNGPKARESLPKSDLMVGLFGLDCFFFSSAVRQEETKVNAKEQNTRPSRTLNVNIIITKTNTKIQRFLPFNITPQVYVSCQKKTCHLVDVKLRFYISFQ